MSRKTIPGTWNGLMIVRGRKRMLILWRAYILICSQDGIIRTGKKVRMAQGPRQPLEEMQAEIERLRHQIAVKDAALKVARDWIAQHLHPVGGETELDTTLQMALDCRAMPAAYAKVEELRARVTVPGQFHGQEVDVLGRDKKGNYRLATHWREDLPYPVWFSLDEIELIEQRKGNRDEHETLYL
jgi:hypothetical protein